MVLKPTIIDILWKTFILPQVPKKSLAFTKKGSGFFCQYSIKWCYAFHWKLTLPPIIAKKPNSMMVEKSVWKLSMKCKYIQGEYFVLVEFGGKRKSWESSIQNLSSVALQSVF